MERLINEIMDEVYGGVFFCYDEDGQGAVAVKGELGDVINGIAMLVDSLSIKSGISGSDILGDVYKAYTVVRDVPFDDDIFEEDAISNTDEMAIRWLEDNARNKELLFDNKEPEYGELIKTINELAKEMIAHYGVNADKIRSDLQF